MQMQMTESNTDTFPLEDGEFAELPLDAINERFLRRPIRDWYVDELVESYNEHGVQPNALKVTPDGVLFSGNHRYEAAKRVGLQNFPVKCEAPNNLDAAARRANESDAVSLPETFVDRAERIWNQLDDRTQQEVAESEGCSRSSIGRYSALQQIGDEAWSEIVTVTNNELRDQLEGAVTRDVTAVTFTFSERLLRNILPLEPDQQSELVERLADDEIGKGKFKRMAKRYEARNEARQHVQSELQGVDEGLVEEAVEEVDRGVYDDEWMDADGCGPNLQQLIDHKLDEWRERESVTLIHGDFFDEYTELPANSVDLVLMDPPYNIANDREFLLEGRGNISQHFGEWDEFEKDEFIDMFAVWADACNRLMAEGASGYIFCSWNYISYLADALESRGFEAKNDIVWHKRNPGPQIQKTGYRNSTEHILYFRRPGADHTFNWPGQNDAHDFLETPICQGSERLTDESGDTLHATQKPESVIRPLIEVSSHPGDLVFDAFMGVGTTGAVAMDMDRKFTGIERHDDYFNAAERRILGG